MTENQQANSADDNRHTPVPSNPMEPCTSGYDEQTSGSTNKLNDKKEPYWQKLLRRWIIVVCTAALTFYTALLYTLTVRQASESSVYADSSFALSKRVADTQEQFAKIETRAYLVVQEVNSERPVVGQPVLIHFFCSNVGKTPAYNTTLIDSVKLSRDITSDEFSNVDKVQPDSGGTVVGGGDIRFGGDVRWRVFTKRDSINLFHRGFKLYLYGNIVYKDKFGESHFTHFAFSYDPTRTTANMVTIKKHQNAN